MKKTMKAVMFAGSLLLIILCGCGKTLGDQNSAVDTENNENSGIAVITAPASDTGDTKTQKKPADDKNTEENGEEATLQKEPDYSGIATKSNGAGVSVHDPSIEVFDGKYYIYGSHMTCAVSEDMAAWKWLGKSYGSKNSVYGAIFDNKEAYAYSGLKTSVIPTDDGNIHVWAPDVIYNKAMQKYVMYFCMSSTWNASNLCFATADSPEGPFEWQGALIYSGFSSQNISSTNVLDYVTPEWATRYTAGGYNYRKYPNAIDPTIFYDADGRMWMVYGSWSGGIFLLEIDEKTGLVIHPEADEEGNVDPYFGKKLAGGNHRSIEGPYIHYEEDTGYYYLYVSYGGLTRTGGYQIRVLRSENVDGPYVDPQGNTLMDRAVHSEYGLKLSGNYFLPSQKDAYMATGGQSLFKDTDGKTYICYHARFESKGEYHEPVVKQVLYNEEGWPCLLPYKTLKETVSEIGYAADEIAGDYYFVDQGFAIDSKVAQPLMIRLNKDGSITGAFSGNWSIKDGSYHMHFTVDGKDFSGVFCKQKDMAGTEVMTFSAGGGLESVYGVKY